MASTEMSLGTSAMHARVYDDEQHITVEVLGADEVCLSISGIDDRTTLSVEMARRLASTLDLAASIAEGAK